jgi:hypothetical protein
MAQRINAFLAPRPPVAACGPRLPVSLVPALHDVQDKWDKEQPVKDIKLQLSRLKLS